MRKLSLLVVATALLVPGMALPARSQEPRIQTHVHQFAMAQWKVTADGERTIYFAAGFTRPSATEPAFVGYVGRAECKKVTRGHHTHFLCRGRARPVELAPGDFVVDPALQTARLSIESEGMSHEFTWEASPDAPQPYFHQHLGTDVGAQVMTAFARKASATGTAFGETLEGSRHGMLSQGVMADAYLDGRAGLPNLRFADDGTLIFRRTFAR